MNVKAYMENFSFKFKTIEILQSKKYNVLIIDACSSNILPGDRIDLFFSRFWCGTQELVNEIRHSFDKSQKDKQRQKLLHWSVASTVPRNAVMIHKR